MHDEKENIPEEKPVDSKKSKLEDDEPDEKSIFALLELR